MDSVAFQNVKSGISVVFIYGKPTNMRAFQFVQDISY